MNLLEIDILLLPTIRLRAYANKRSEELKKSLLVNNYSFNGCPNRPHISLYQLNCEEGKVPKLIEAVKRLIADYRPVSMDMDRLLRIAGQNIFWDCSEAKKEHTLQQLLSLIVEEARQFKADKPLRQIQDNIKKLTLEQIELVEKYGVFWGLPHNFDPHITMIYQANPIDDGLKRLVSQTAIENHVFTPEFFSIAEIGYYGNVIRLIENFLLQ